MDDVLDAHETVRQAVADRQTVTAAGGAVAALTHGVSFHPSSTHADERGSVVELYDSRWNWHPDPLVFAYAFTIRPGMAKGWNLHKRHDDRYFILQGEMELDRAAAVKPVSLVISEVVP